MESTPADLPMATALCLAMEASPCPAALFDAQDRLRWSNRAYRETFGVVLEGSPTWAEVVRDAYVRGVGTSIRTEDFDAWLKSASSRRGKLPYRQFEVDLCDGRWMLMTETVCSQGWMLCFASDVSDLARDHRELRTARDLAERASRVDALTGIANRAFVLQCLAESMRDGGPKPCVALVDLDLFKAVNDRYGHAAGDRVLCDFAQRLQGGLRRIDACGRIGGEEFLVVLRDIEPAAAVEVVQRLLAQVREARPLPDWPQQGYTASAGLVQARSGERPEDVMARADVALYLAKDGGRDRCVAHLD